MTNACINFLSDSNAAAAEVLLLEQEFIVMIAKVSISALDVGKPKNIHQCTCFQALSSTIFLSYTNNSLVT